MSRNQADLFDMGNVVLETSFIFLNVDFPTLHRTAHCVEWGNLQKRKKYKAIISSRVLGEINLTQSVNSKKETKNKKGKIQLKTLLSVRANVLKHRSRFALAVLSLPSPNRGQGSI